MILIGEMRDEETVHTALSAAETGHLVFSTVHTVDAAETVNRLIDFFPPHMHNQVRAMIAGTLKGVVSQRLVPTIDGRGRVACCEVLRMTGRVARHDHGPGRRPETAGGHRRAARYYGMQTFDQALFEHFKAGRVEMDTAEVRDQPARLQAPGRRRRQARHHDGRPPRPRASARALAACLTPA